MPDFELQEMDPIPPNENVFWHDSYHMGGEPHDVSMMFAHFGHEVNGIPDMNEYIILVHIPTGKRVRILLPKA